jgi:hypothetical protein
VQIINFRNTHWITISNKYALPLEVFIYDSYVSLSQKLKSVCYPPEVGEIACKLRRPPGHLHMTVVEVQQQTRGYDCGLCSIAYAASLCMDVNPGTLNYRQPQMRRALLQSLDPRDMTSFVTRAPPPVHNTPDICSTFTTYNSAK